MATILIVEDEELIRNLLKATLIPDYRVVEAVNVTQATEMFHKVRPALVLLDLNLRDQHDGLEVCRVVRSNPDPVLARTPIIMLTGRTRQTDIGAALAAGADSYIGKPYNPLSLLTLIDTVLAR